MATASNITDGVPANCPGSRVLFQGLGQLEKAVSAYTASMDNALGNSLVVEMSDFFAQDEIFQQCRTARIGSQGVLIVGNRQALIRRQRWLIAGGRLVPLSAAAD